MNFRHPIPCTAGLAVLLVWSATVSRGQLAANSPFVPSAGSAAAATTQNGPLEYWGMIETPQGALYRVFDQAKKRTFWVKLNERNAEFGVEAKKYDSDRSVLTVEQDGRTLALEERRAKIISSGAANQVVVAPPMPAPSNMAPAVTQSVVVNPTPAEEQKRLEAVAAEVARRRALREQAATQVGQSVAPQPAPQLVAPPMPAPRVAPQSGVQNQSGSQRRGNSNTRQPR